ncbi:hypothetical protein A6302_02455 [Methylobrevis pamukkalensis]|uniref:Uncharacterized protein n=1 Tax=Methylobrevis pamukkalensis TaxID=1439726 RepID=A0A1E3H1S4_9HYPH|nr:hypothetical protein A6302_02455 [Methylobrevis pamukkalensis]
MAGLRVGFDEDGEMPGRLVEAGELEAGVKAGAIVGPGSQRRGVGGFEVGAHGCPPGRIDDGDEAPRLAVADRGGERRRRDQAGREIRIDGIGAKAAHVAPPAEEIAEARAKIRVEGGRPALARPRHTASPQAARYRRIVSAMP